jgi:urease gamma subunit
MRLSPRHSLAVSLTVCSALVAGCGSHGGPKLEHEDGVALISLVHRITNEGADGRARDIPELRDRAIALINAKKVPADLQEPLLSMVNAIEVQPDAARNLEAWLRRYSR